MNAKKYPTGMWRRAVAADGTRYVVVCSRDGVQCGLRRVDRPVTRRAPSRRQALKIIKRQRRVRLARIHHRLLTEAFNRAKPLFESINHKEN